MACAAARARLVGGWRLVDRTGNCRRGSTVGILMTARLALCVLLLSAFAETTRGSCASPKAGAFKTCRQACDCKSGVCKKRRGSESTGMCTVPSTTSRPTAAPTEAATKTISVRLPRVSAPHNPMPTPGGILPDQWPCFTVCALLGRQDLLQAVGSPQRCALSLCQGVSEFYRTVRCHPRPLAGERERPSPACSRSHPSCQMQAVY